MMKAQIKSIDNPEISDLKNYQPKERDNFCILFRVMVGPKDSPGEESFDIQVCTPQWLLSTFDKNEVILGRHFIIVFEYNFDNIFNRIKHIIENYQGNNWNELAQKIGQIGCWEFEDYDDFFSKHD